MKISQVIKKLQEIKEEHGDLPCCAYLYKEATPVRHVGVRDIHIGFDLTTGKEKIVQEVFIEGDKHQNL